MKRQRILLVDDSSFLTNLFRLVLEKTGQFIVHEENAGENAVETARRFRPDLILLDDELGSPKGSDILGDLGSDAELHAIPVAFITGSERKEDAERHGLHGLRALAKPLWPDDLITFATDLLAGRLPRRKMAHAG